MQMESSASDSVTKKNPVIWDNWLIWDHWSAEPAVAHRRFPRVGGHRHVPRVIPGNPSLPLRLLFSGGHRKMNGGKDGTELGIDLAVRGHEVRKLFYAGGFTGVLNREGIDPDEFLQEVYRGLLARNKGTCPWDYKKSSFGHYVHIVIRCVLSNYLRRERLRGTREGVTDDGEMPVGAAVLGGGTVELQDLLEGIYGVGTERDRVHLYLSALYAGQTRRESLGVVGMSDDWGQRVLAEVRTALTES